MRLSKVFIPNAITSIGILLGYISIMLTLNGYYVIGAWLLLVIALLDSLDGRVARALTDVMSLEKGAQVLLTPSVLLAAAVGPLKPALSGPPLTGDEMKRAGLQ